MGRTKSKSRRQQQGQKSGDGAGGGGGKKQKPPKSHYKAGKFRKRNAEKNAEDDTNDTQHNTFGGLLECASYAQHTCGVTIRQVRLVDVEQDEEVTRTGNSEEKDTTKKKKKKKRRGKRKPPRPVVVTSPALPPPEINDPSSETAASSSSQKIHWSQSVPVIHVKPLIVLDLNGILCRRVRYDRIQQQQNEEAAMTGIVPAPIQFRPAIGHVAGTPVIARTDLWYMLSYLDANFTLAVWTSAKMRTARILIQMLFPPDIANRLLFVWGQDKCDVKTVATNTVKERNCDNSGEGEEGHDNEEKNDSDIDNNVNKNDKVSDNAAATTSSAPSSSTETIFGKSLGKVWAKYPLWDETNTLLVDDSPEKAQRWIGNTLHPPPILGTAADDDTSEKTNHDLANAIGQRVFFQKLVEYWQGIQRRHGASGNDDDDDDGRFYSMLALESSEHRRQRKKIERQKLYEFLKGHGSCHMGWRGDGEQKGS